MPITLKTMSMKYRERPSDDWSPAMVQAVAPLDPVKEMIGIVVDGKRPSQAVTAGQYVIVKNSTITGITDGLYTAKNALSTSADVSASDLNAEITNGVANDLKNSIDNFLLAEEYTVAVTNQFADGYYGDFEPTYSASRIIAVFVVQSSSNLPAYAYIVNNSLIRCFAPMSISSAKIRIVYTMY